MSELVWCFIIQYATDKYDSIWWVQHKVFFKVSPGTES